MSLLSLSNELLLEIASCFKYDSDINALMQTTGRLYYLLNTHLYRHNIRYFESSALEWAICNDVIPVAQKMLDEGVPVNFLIGDSQAIKLAIRYGHESMVELFLERGVDPNPAELVYPIEEAGRKTKRLYEEDEAETPLHYALLNGSASTVRLLILHAKNFRGVQPTVGLWCEVPPEGEGLRIPASLADLMSACSKQDPTVVEFLALNIRSSVGAMGQEFISHMPLIEAVDLNHLGVTRVLLNAGYDPNYYSDDSGGEVPLHFAIKEDSIETVRLLLEKGARPDFAYKAYNENSLELLNQAARCGNAAIVKLLLQHIDVESKITSGHEEWNTLITTAAAFGYMDIFQMILKKNKMSQGDKFALHNKYLRPPLSLAAEKGHTDTVALLLDHGSDVHYGGMSTESYTPLIMAVSNGHTEIVKLLLDRGINLSFEGFMAHTRHVLWTESPLARLLFAIQQSFRPYSN